MAYYSEQYPAHNVNVCLSWFFLSSPCCLGSTNQDISSGRVNIAFSLCLWCDGVFYCTMRANESLLYVNRFVESHRLTSLLGFNMLMLDQRKWTALFLRLLKARTCWRCVVVILTWWPPYVFLLWLPLPVPSLNSIAYRGIVCVYHYQVADDLTGRSSPLPPPPPSSLSRPHALKAV